MAVPLAYFITFRTYGTFLHGDERGAVDREHNVPGTSFLPHDPVRQQREQELLKGPPYLLDQSRRMVTLRAILEIVGLRKWFLHAAHVRTNHVHAVVTAPGLPELVMTDLKGKASRLLNVAYPEERKPIRWARHGSTIYLWTEEELAEAIDCVLNRQGEPMGRYPDQPNHARSAAQ